MDIVTISRRWVFMGITFDASTNKYYCLLDETRFDASIAAVNQPNQRDFNFEARRTYLIDDLIYLPKYVTSDESMVIYNQSTYNYNLFADVILFKMHGGVIDKHSEYFFDFSSYVVMLSSVHMFVLQIGKWYKGAPLANKRSLKNLEFLALKMLKIWSIFFFS